MVLHTDGNKIQSCAGIIVAFQADTATVVFFWIVVHCVFVLKDLYTFLHTNIQN